MKNKELNKKIARSSDGSSPSTTAGRVQEEKKIRLNAALRSNLKKRKIQTRNRNMLAKPSVNSDFTEE